MVGYKTVSLLCWIGVGGTAGSVYLEYLPETVAVPIISILIALGFVTAGLGFMAKGKKEEEEERKETFVGY